MGLWTGGGCQPSEPQNETGVADGSETDSCPPGAQGCVCGEGASCEPGLLCASNTCIPGNEVTTTASGPQTTTLDTEDSGVVTDATADTTEPTGTTETGGECDPGAGLVNDACGGPTPYCGAEGTCVGCAAITCADASASTPVCDADTGQCVQCSEADTTACSGVTPLCDAPTATCVGCTDHASCPSGACQLDTGACFEKVVHVDRASPCGGDGSPELPYCEIQDAVAPIDQAEPTVVRVKPSATPYSKQVQVAANRTVAIIRDGGGVAKLEVDALDSLVVNDGATLYLSLMQISKGDVSKGILCSNAALRLDRTQIIDRPGLGIEGIACDLQLRQSRLYLNRAGAIKMTGGDLLVENSYVVSNGGSFAAVSGIVVSNMATVDIIYSTIVANDGKAGVEDSLDCSTAGPVKLRNSIVFGQSGVSSVDCTTATATTSVFDSEVLKGEGNTVIPFVEGDWFVAPDTGNFAVKSGPPFEDVGLWITGDPTVDYDGTPRPTTEGAKDFVGADRPK